MIALQCGIHHYGRLDGAGTVEWCRRALEHTGPQTSVRRTAQTYLAHPWGTAAAGRSRRRQLAARLADRAP